MKYFTILLLVLVLSSCRKDFKEEFELERTIELKKAIKIDANSIEGASARYVYIDIVENLIEPDLAKTIYRTYTDYSLTDLKIQQASIDRSIYSSGTEMIDSFNLYLNSEKLAGAQIRENSNTGYSPLFNYVPFSDIDIKYIINEDYGIFDCKFEITQNAANPFRNQLDATLVISYKVVGEYWTEE